MILLLEVRYGSAKQCDNAIYVTIGTGVGVGGSVELEAYYIAQAITNYILTYSPEKIILWGGVMHIDGLMNMVRKKTMEMLGGYLQNDKILNHIEEYIIFPALGENPGIVGALELARTAEET